MPYLRNVLNTYDKDYTPAEKFTKPLRGFLGGRKIVNYDSGKTIYSKGQRALIGLFLVTVGIPYTLAAGIVLAFSPKSFPEDEENLKSRTIQPKKSESTLSFSTLTSESTSSENQINLSSILKNSNAKFNKILNGSSDEENKFNKIYEVIEKSFNESGMDVKQLEIENIGIDFSDLNLLVRRALAEYARDNQADVLFDALLEHAFNEAFNKVEEALKDVNINKVEARAKLSFNTLFKRRGFSFDDIENNDVLYQRYTNLIEDVKLKMKS